MAKRPTLESPFARTEPGTAARSAIGDIPEEGRTLPISVGLKESEIKLLDDYAAEFGIARNALMRWGLRWFLLELRAGRVPISKSIKTEQKTTIEMP